MRIRRALPLALALSPLFGCATILNGSHQTIHVETDPPGATVTVAGERHTTPFDVVLRRKSEALEVVIEKDGYVTKRIPLARRIAGHTWVNFLGIPVGGAAGAVVGAQSGSGYDQLSNSAGGMAVGALAVTGLFFAVDAGSGAMYRLDPPAIAVRLEPAPVTSPVATR
jgi:hypothetical protein